MDRNQMAEIYDRHKNTVYRAALAYCRNVQDAEDVTQEVFLARFAEMRSFTDTEAEKAWLIRVTVNKCKNLLKSFRRKHTVALDEVRELCADSAESEVFDAVNSLPDKYRILIHLYYAEGYSVKEIADLTSCTETAVQTRLYRARQKLRIVLKEEFNYEIAGV